MDQNYLLASLGQSALTSAKTRPGQQRYRAPSPSPSKDVVWHLNKRRPEDVADRGDHSVRVPVASSVPVL
jgi:hypothetical protein